MRGPCRIAINGVCHRLERGPRGGGSGSETQHLPNIKSGTSITRSSRGARFLKAETRSRRRDEKEGERRRGKCRRRGSEEQEILDSRDAYSQCGLRDFRSIPVPFCRVSRISGVNDRSPRRIGFNSAILNTSTTDWNEIMDEYFITRNKSEIKLSVLRKDEIFEKNYYFNTETYLTLCFCFLIS